MSEADRGKGKKRSKAYYSKYVKQQRRRNDCMEPGQKGFLVTCNANEKQCVRETYALLNQFADRLYGPEMPEKQSDDVGDDIEDMIQKEVENLKKTALKERRFQALDSGAKNCIFIKTQLSDPCHLVHEILLDVKKTQKQCFRYILRLLPVTSICKAYLEDIKKAAEDLSHKYFQEPGSNGKTFAIIFKVRNNCTISRDDIIPALASAIQQMNPANKADLKFPQLAVIVNVIGKYCCLAVVPDYYQLKKYNLMELIDKTATDVPKVEEVAAVAMTSETSGDKLEKTQSCEEVLEVENGSKPEGMEAKIKCDENVSSVNM